ncbi:U6 snRNA-associated Sm-like protein LSm7 [Lojkania enalia]|uniref:U6 snRNA-associated Sm-like protein LSm7 n=1 Tax=Lojkania enalia TaxID=147567 RepID=A0A9P4K1T4_9PLEO|nr:U6 snRNA-associated Sm-like protein LSm7 [Didymosphaeria enalia]
MSSERGAFRGRADRGTTRGSTRGGRGTHQTTTTAERPKKENILDLSKYMDKRINVKFSGGREVIGTLKGYDQLMNLVLDEVREAMSDDQGTVRHRKLGLIVARGTLLVVISPVDGSEEIANPFLQEDE